MSDPMVVVALITTAGSLVVAILSFTNSRRTSADTSRPATQTASAAEVEKLGERLDKQTDRIDELERKVRGLYRYIDEDHDDHRAHGWPIRPLPEELA